MVIEEAQDLKTLKLDFLVRKLLTHQIHLQEENEEHGPQQGPALKSNDIEMSPRDDSGFRTQPRSIGPTQYRGSESIEMGTNGSYTEFGFEGHG